MLIKLTGTFMEYIIHLGLMNWYVKLFFRLQYELTFAKIN